ncbi:hypothetical protein [Aliiroseovarius sp. M344]|nr:hypothetical protein [Aliiroseovarius sp. M344]
MTPLRDGPVLARTDIPSPFPILHDLRSLVAWINACLEGRQI